MGQAGLAGIVGAQWVSRMVVEIKVTGDQCGEGVVSEQVTRGK